MTVDETRKMLDATHEARETRVGGNGTLWTAKRVRAVNFRGVRVFIGTMDWME